MNKKVKIAAISGCAVLILGVGIGFGVKHFQKGTIPVYSMEELAQEVWGNMSSLEGSVSSNVSQQVRLLDKQIVSQVHVKEGQEVKEGDPLLTYDMTLVNIDLETEKINKQQLEVKKKGLEHELKNLKNGKWSSVSANKEYDFELLGNEKKEWKVLKTAQEGNGEITELPQEGSEQMNPQGGEQDPSKPQGGEQEPSNPQGGEQEPSNPQGGEQDPSKPQGGEQEPSNPQGGEQEPSNPQGGEQDPSNPQGGEQNPSNPPTEDPDQPTPPEEEITAIAYSRLYWDIALTDPIPPKAEENVLVEAAVPYKQEGNTLYFLCKKDVWVQGAFLNHIAGFRGGEEKEESAFQCVLEQHIEDKIGEPMLSQITIYGDKIEERFEPETWYRSKLGLSEWEEVPIPGVEEPDEDIFMPTPGEAIVGGYSKEELNKAIGEKEREIVTAGLDIREADLKIKKTEQKLKDEVVRSTINGVVKKVGDPSKGEIDGEPFIVVESSGGVFIKGYVAEDMLGKVQPGQIVSGMAYESMMPFQAEVKEVSPYPAEDYTMYGNREVTYYPFTAFIQDSEGLKDREMVTMDLPQEDGAITGIFLSKEYVRSKDGEDYVLKLGKHGKLEKQEVRTGRTFYGSLIEIKEGLTKEDYVAFPYGKKVKEGAKTRKSTLEELYQYY